MVPSGAGQATNVVVSELKDCSEDADRFRNPTTTLDRSKSLPKTYCKCFNVKISGTVHFFQIHDMVLRWGVRRYILSIKICVCSYFTAEGTNRRCGEETLCFPSKSSCLPKDENITKNVEIGGAFISVNFYLAQKSSTFVSIRAVLNLASGLVFLPSFVSFFEWRCVADRVGPKLV